MNELKSIIEKLQSATNLKDAIASAKQALPHIIVSVQKFSEQLEEGSGEQLSGEDKKALVIRAAQEQITPFLNKYFNLPFLSEAQEAVIINRGIELFIGGIIDKLVKSLKKNGWTIS